MEVKAIKEIRYAGENYKPGKRFTASEKDAKILIVIGKVEPYVAPEPKTSKVEERTVEPKEDAPKPNRKNQYRRRDMRA